MSTSSEQLCAGRVVLITGAGRGIGREHALAFVAAGAHVIISDVDDSAAHVAEEITALGGRAIATTQDITQWDGAEAIVAEAIAEFGHLDVVVNNAGILRDRMFVNMSEKEWDDVIDVHLKGSIAITRHAVDHWRARSKAGEDVNGRVIMTSSPSGLFGNIGQTNYGAAKAALAAVTVMLADELQRLDVTVNAIAPVALTRMTEDLPGFADAAKSALEQTGFNPFDPANISPLVVWLGSVQSAGVTGRVFTVMGGEIGVAETWVKGPVITKNGRWDPAELTERIPGLVAQARSNSDMMGNPRQGSAQGIADITGES
jgi:NAD(P)-dependent dehydrogenase (short-subunit alcohol dehydrogenase family)